MAVAGKTSTSQGRTALRRDGVQLSVPGSAGVALECLTLLKQFVEAGKVQADIDRRYPQG